MEVTKITIDQAHELQLPYLKSDQKKKLGITGYQLLAGWYIDFETAAAYKISGINETGDAVNKDWEDVEKWIPKSQTVVFESQDDCDLQYDGETLIFVRTWLFNENKSQFNLNKFKNMAY